MEFTTKERAVTLTDEVKKKIDAMSYKELLYHWRFAPSGDERFCGEAGEYWCDRMKELRDGGANHVAASKSIGWES